MCLCMLQAPLFLRGLLRYWQNAASEGGFNRSDGDTDIRYFNFFMAHCRSSWFVESDR